MPVIEQIRTRLEAEFRPTELEVVDESELHRGHAGHREEGESHFRIAIKAPAFAGMTRIERHRAVHEALGRDLVGRIHALAMKIDA